MDTNIVKVNKLQLKDMKLLFEFQPVEKYLSSSLILKLVMCMDNMTYFVLQVHTSPQIEIVVEFSTLLKLFQMQFQLC